MSEKTKYPLHGVAVSLNTPFDASGEIDFDSLGRCIEMHLAEGACGFLSPAQAGEVNVLRFEERVAMIRFIQERVRGRGLFIAGATSPDEKDSFRTAEAALAAGCEAVLVEIPANRQRDRDATLAFCRSFASVGMPMLVIQDLDWNGSGIDVAWIVEMFETIDAFRCLKVEVRPAGPKYTEVIEATGGRLMVAGGWAAEQMIEALDRGVDVFMSTAMTGLYTRVIRSHAADRRAEARAWFEKLLPVLAFTHQHLDISIQFYKRLFKHRSIFQTIATRKDCVPYDRYHERYGEELIRYLDAIECDMASH